MCNLLTVVMPKLKSEPIEVRWEMDEYPDLSYLDMYTMEDHLKKLKKCSSATRHALCEKYGSLRKTAQHYYEEEQYRIESYNDGNWCMLGCYALCKVYIPQGEKYFSMQTFRSGGLWGIESDSGREYTRSVEQTEIEDLKSILVALGIEPGEVEDD
jgi:hypothetical protein